MRIVDIKSLFDELCVFAVLGEDNGLTELVPIIHLNAIKHKMFQHLVDRILVKQALIDFGGADVIGWRLILAPIEHIPLLFFVLR